MLAGLMDLAHHVCLNLRLPTYGGLYVWEFEHEGREERVRVSGQITFNPTAWMLTGLRKVSALPTCPRTLQRRTWRPGV